MDLYCLNNNFYLDTPIEGFDSLVWTERFASTGDFKLETSKIEETMAEVPVGSCLGILQSDEVMYVDTHEITKDDDGRYKLTISGETFESFMRYRTNAAGLGIIGTDTTIVESAGESGVNPTGSIWAANIAGMNMSSSWSDDKDNIPWVLFDVAVTKVTAQAFRKETLSNNLYDRVKELIDSDALGIRNVRPTPPDQNLIIRIYNGFDRSSSVVLDAGKGHFKTANYMRSIKDTYTVGYGRSDKVVGQKYRRNGMPGTFSQTDVPGYDYRGLDRRVLYVDCTDIKESGQYGIPREQALMATRIDAALFQKSYKGVILDCDVAPTIPYIYGQHYYLGDSLLCVGEFGINQKMMVTEYIRTQDSSGEYGYPSLVAI